MFLAVWTLVSVALLLAAAGAVIAGVPLGVLALAAAPLLALVLYAGALAGRRY